jgi:hypothetical protein
MPLPFFHHRIPRDAPLPVSPPEKGISDCRASGILKLSRGKQVSRYAESKKEVGMKKSFSQKTALPPAQWWVGGHKAKVFSSEKGVY